eukprot:Transcript_23397.p1 GENE.Transcript_23397~~Transcript_23397.p1  ORF type:complete len:336 (-),score=112.55 Transcript_23397:226-1233(-)
MVVEHLWPWTPRSAREQLVLQGLAEVERPLQPHERRAEAGQHRPLRSAPATPNACQLGRSARRTHEPRLPALREPAPPKPPATAAAAGAAAIAWVKSFADTGFWCLKQLIGLVPMCYRAFRDIPPAERELVAHFVLTGFRYAMCAVAALGCVYLLNSLPERVHGMSEASKSLDDARSTMAALHWCPKTPGIHVHSFTGLDGTNYSAARDVRTNLACPPVPPCPAPSRNTTGEAGAARGTCTPLVLPADLPALRTMLSCVDAEFLVALGTTYKPSGLSAKEIFATADADKDGGLACSELRPAARAHVRKDYYEHDSAQREAMDASVACDERPSERP